MSRTLKRIAVAVVIVGIVGLGVFLYMTRDLEAPSTDIQDAAVELETTDASGDVVIFRLTQGATTAEFNINEVLNGRDKTVVGTTNQVAGDILINLSDPSQSQVGVITINARTFATDSRQRDNMIGRFILQAENRAYEFITFTPTALTGLPDAIAVGETVEAQVTGDLTIAGVTNSVTFDVTVTLDSETALSGVAQTTIQYPDFNISIPRVPQVASVEDTVILKLNFTAQAVTGA